MKLIPRARRPIRSVRTRPADADAPTAYADRRTPVTMDKRGGMALEDRQDCGLIMGLGTRFRLPQRGVDPPDSGPGPAGQPFRKTAVTRNDNQRLLGLPMLRFEVEVKQRGQAYRVLEPSTRRFRMRAVPDEDRAPDPRFHLAGRGGPRVLVGDTR
jgi:hypothetical protein